MRRRLLFNNKKCNKNDQSHQKTQEIPYEIEKGLSFWSPFLLERYTIDERETKKIDENPVPEE